MKAISAISTYGFASSRAFSISGSQALPILLVAFVALYQTHTYLPSAAQSFRLPALLVWFSMAIFIGGQCGDNVLRQAQWPSIIFPFSPRINQIHPIEDLVLKSRAEFSAMVERQSKSLPDAIQEYQRRYHRAPPPGFDLWYQMAQEANTTLIDEYDLLMQDLEPFWGMSAQELHSKTAMVSTNDVWIRRLSVRTTRWRSILKGMLPTAMKFLKL